VLNWNIRGLNNDDKQKAVRAKIEESGCFVFCIQETKKEIIDYKLIKKIAPKRFSRFAFVPSVGASGGILLSWNDVVLKGEVM
jgi:exonuclease III